MLEGFKLINLQLYEHYIFPSLDISFVSDHDINNPPYNDEPFSTIVIGLNGSGKSNVLRALIDIFRELYDYKQYNQRKAHINGLFSITYLLDKFIYTFKNFENINLVKRQTRSTEYFFQKNGYDCKINDMILPNKLLASTIMLTDKFLVLGKNQNFDIYEYLGVRRTASTAGTRTYVRKTVEFIVNSLEKPDFNSDLEYILNFLNLKKSCIISYDLRYRKDIIDVEINESTLVDFFERYRESYEAIPENNRSFAWFGFQYYLTIQHDKSLMKQLTDFCQYIQQTKSQKKKGSPTQVIKYDIFDTNTIQRDYPLIKHLYRLDLLSFPNIIFQKEEGLFDFEESSSGEANFISSVLGILANMETNSLVLLDEPEISLHPNWQMKYISTIKQMLRHRKDSHLVIATHSHFMVSDLEPTSSAVVSLKSNVEKVDNKVFKKFIGAVLPGNTYGWSAEQILLEVFKTPTTRNYFIAEKVGDLLELISKPQRDVTLIRIKVAELIEENVINLSDDDPLKPVIDKLVEKYG